MSLCTDMVYMFMCRYTCTSIRKCCAGCMFMYIVFASVRYNMFTSSCIGSDPCTHVKCTHAWTKDICKHASSKIYTCMHEYSMYERAKTVCLCDMFCAARGERGRHRSGAAGDASTQRKDARTGWWNEWISRLFIHRIQIRRLTCFLSRLCLLSWNFWDAKAENLQHVILANNIICMHTCDHVDDYYTLLHNTFAKNHFSAKMCFCQLRVRISVLCHTIRCCDNMFRTFSMWGKSKAIFGAWKVGNSPKLISYKRVDMVKSPCMTATVYLL
jgi:hypothetical protein